MNLLRALFTVSSFTFISRILGFIRDTVIARSFGAGLYTDAFFVAFKLPNLLRRIFAEGAFSQAFVPILSEYHNQKGEEETQILINKVSSVLAVVLFLITSIGIIAAPILVYISAPGFDKFPAKFDITVQLLQVTFPYILFISLVSFTSSVLNTYQQFSVPAFTPVFLNISFIGFALWLAPYFHPPVLALAWAVFFGGIIQLLFQIPFLIKIKKLPRWDLDYHDKGVRRVLKQMAPALLGVSISQISLLINTIFASFLVSGSVSWIYYADRLMEFPVGILGVALGSILLPSLSKAHASNDSVKYSKLLDWGLRLTILLSLPAILGLAQLSVPLITTLFHYGHFSINDVYMTQRALVAYSIGLVGLILIKILAPGFYAKQDVRTPVKIAIITLISTQLMNLAFIFPLQHAGLSLSIALGSCLNAAMLFWGLKKRAIYTPEKGWLRFFLSVIAGLVAMFLVFLFFAGDDTVWLHARMHERVLRLGLLIIAGAGVYFATLRIMGMRLSDFRAYVDK